MILFLLAKSHINPSRLNYSDSFCSDSDEVDEVRSAYIKRNHIQTTSTWTKVKNTLSAFIMSVLTFLMTPMKSVYTSFIQRKKVASKDYN